MATITPRSRRQVHLVAHPLTIREQFTGGHIIRRLVQVTFGLCGYGISLTFMLHSAWGMLSWNVLSEGIVNLTPLSFGQATILIAFIALMFWIPLKERIGLATVLNVVLVGMAADAAVPWVPHATGPLSAASLCVCGLVLFAFSDALYLGARFGSGPKDGLVTALVRHSRRSFWLVRLIVDFTVTLIGWIIGGHVGLGTIVLVLFTGPLIHFFLQLTTVPLTTDRHVMR